MVVVQEKVEGRKRATGGGAWEGARVRVCKRGAAGDKKGAPASGVGGPVVKGVREWAGSVGKKVEEARLLRVSFRKTITGEGKASVGLQRKKKAATWPSCFSVFFGQLTGRYY
jgi:hypothetical protein